MIGALLAVGGLLGLVSRVPHKGRQRADYLLQGGLVQGSCYRLFLCQETASKERLEGELRALGFEPLLITKDPTDAHAFGVLARWEKVESGLLPPRGFYIAHIEEAETPQEEKVEPSPFGPGLLARESQAIQLALLKDLDSKHLSGFSTTLFPDFPFAGALLHAKGVLAGRRARGVSKAKMHSAYEKMEHKLKALLAQKEMTETLDSLTVFPGEELEAQAPGVWGGVKDVLPESFVPRVEFWKKQEALKLLKDDATPAEQVAAFALLNPEEKPESKVLHELGFSQLFSLLPGNTVTEKAASLVALRNVPDKRRVLLPVTGSKDLRAVSRIVQALLREPAMLCLYPRELAEKQKVEEDAARIALGIVQEIAEGVALVRKEDLLLLDPQGLLGKEPIAPSAFQLAFATFRPEESHVADPKRVLSRVESVKQLPGGHEALERAKNALQRQKWVDWYARLMQTQGLETPTLTGR